MQNQHTPSPQPLGLPGPLPSRPCFTYTCCRCVSMTLPEDFLSFPCLLAERGGLCQPFCALHDMERMDGRTEGRCVSSPLTLSVLVLARQKEERLTNERTDADSGRHLCLMDRRKVRKTTTAAAPFRHSARVSAQSPLPRQERTKEEETFHSVPVPFSSLRKTHELANSFARSPSHSKLVEQRRTRGRLRWI